MAERLNKQESRHKFKISTFNIYDLFLGLLFRATKITANRGSNATGEGIVKQILY